MELYEFLSTHPDKWPTCMIYKKCLDMACKKFRINVNEAKKRYGFYTSRQWLELLQSMRPCYYFYVVSNHAKNIELVAKWHTDNEDTMIQQACAMCACARKLRYKTASVIVLENNDSDRVAHTVDLRGNDTLSKFRETITAAKQERQV